MAAVFSANIYEILGEEEAEIEERREPGKVIDTTVEMPAPKPKKPIVKAPKQPAKANAGQGNNKDTANDGVDDLDQKSSRGARGTDRDARTVKRQFDRHSAGKPGSERNERRGGAGKYNWGTSNDELQAEAPEAEAAPTETEGEAVEKKEPVPEVPAEPEGPEEKTLDEFYESIKKPDIKAPKLRKPGEGVEANKQWKVAKPIAREDPTDFLFAGAKKEKKEREKKQKVKEIIMHAGGTADNTVVSDNNRNDRGRGRGGFRGGRGRGGGRGGRGGFRGGGGYRGGGGNGSLNVKDDQSFPALK